MRIFWSLVAVLLLAGAAAWWLRSDSATGAQNRPTTAAAPDRGAGSSLAGTSANDTAPAAAAPQSTEPAAELPHAATDDAASQLASELASELASSASDRLGSGPALPSAAAAPTDGTTDADDLEPGLEMGLEMGLDASIPSATVSPGRIVEADGALRADDRFTIPGAGTPEDPYVIGWDILVSAMETYQPRLGELRIPQRVAMLNGKWVRIEGFAAFPIVSADPRELLLMLNQWDGCCIGVPPTPYDAIEVRLGQPPQSRRQRVAYYGAVTGRLAVEPYLIDNWLVGLYLMDNATFTMDF